MHNQLNPLWINFANKLAPPILPFVLVVAIFAFASLIVKSLAVITFSIILTMWSCFNLKWIHILLTMMAIYGNNNANDEALRPERTAYCSVLVLFWACLLAQSKSKARPKIAMQESQDDLKIAIYLLDSHFAVCYYLSLINFLPDRST